MDCIGPNVGSEILRSAQNDSGLRIGREKETQNPGAL